MRSANAKRTLGLLIFLVFSMVFVFGQPTGVDVTFNESINVSVAPGTAITTAGGSFTTLVLNVTQQNARWKAYVGNVTGTLVLQDSNDLNIYDWSLSSISGEVYASRNNSIDWGSIGCLTPGVLEAEETAMNISTSAVDSINRTFNETTHQSFWVGSTQIPASNCKAIATYVNDTRQDVSEDADFQEILLDDGSNLIYATILEQDQQGYDLSKTFDFQMILAENEFTPASETYYFYAEIY